MSDYYIYDYILFVFDVFTCVLDSYTNCDIYIKNLEEGKLQAQPGCTEEETLEVKNYCHSCHIFCGLKEATDFWYKTLDVKKQLSQLL